jgi:hypothetical protein
MARARTTGPEPPKAWRKRKAISVSMLGASAQPSEATQKRTSPPASTGLRP